MKTLTLLASFGYLAVTAQLPAAGALIISEFMAANDGSLRDTDGDASDWIEIYNAGTNLVSLAGWHLTDDPAVLAKWTFPATNLAPDHYLMVFASGKDRAVAGAELHTSFQLDSAGDYLALVEPDGQTIAHQFAPAFPAQVEGVSFGVEIRTMTTHFIVSGAEARWTVPSGPGGMVEGWNSTNFNDAAWTTGRTGLGFDAGTTNGVLPGTATNLALGKPASQSSTGYGFGPELAVDGNPGNFTHTAPGQGVPATWEINLGTNCALEKIIIHNRTDCCQSRLRDITVSILSADGARTNYTSPLLNPENVLGSHSLNGPAALTADLTNLTGGLVLGGRVRITRTPDPDLSGTSGQGNGDEPEVLSMSEVEVMGELGSPLAGLIRTDLSAAMLGRNATVLVRIPFIIPVDGMPLLDLLALRMQYDDGWVAWLNGVEVARRNAPATPTWNSAATGGQTPAGMMQSENIDLTPFLSLLQEGGNVLAIQGLNVSAADGDFLILPELIGKAVRIATEGYFAQPTPGAVNTASSLGFVADTKFSVDRGFFSGPFSVEITTATPGAEIRYTTNGSAPSALDGLAYSGPITISRTTVLRAIAIKPGYQPSDVDTQTYIFLSEVVAQNAQKAQSAGFPSSWVGVAADYDMDPRITSPNAAQMEASMRSLPSFFVTTSVSNLFDVNNGIYSHPTSGGAAWERPAAIEMVNPDGSTDFRVNCGLRMQGGYFRQATVTQKHSLRVLFKGQYGPGKLRHDVFKEPGAAQEFDTLVLRAGANDGYAWSDAKDTEQFIRDEFGRHLQLDTGHPGVHGTFVHLYLNGLYWGLYNLVEHPNEDFSAAYFGGQPEEWDSNNAGDIKNGDLQAWNTFIGLVQQTPSLTNYQGLQGNNADGTRNPASPVYLDALNYIDYMIVNIWGGNWDWPNKNFWFGRLRTADSSGFKFYTWDYENTMGNNLARSPTNMVTPRSDIASSWVGAPHYYLKNLAEYRLDFADRVHRFFFNGGLLTPPALTNRYRVLADRVEASIIPETARWGDDNLDPPQDQADWFRERDWILGTYLPVRSGIVLGQFRAAGLYPSVSAPVFSQHGGGITNGFPLAMFQSNSLGVIYYTLDGADPRLVGGAVSSLALAYTNAVALTRSARVKARVRSGSDWSALNEADFALPEVPALRVTELMYHPAPPSAAEIAAGFSSADDFEFIELRNVGPAAISLAGINFDKGISFAFESGLLAAGARIVLVKNLAAFTSRYGAVGNLAGTYSGNLNNAGERLRLLDAAGRVIQDFSYGDGWYPTTDGLGFSLAIVDDSAAASSWDSPANWRPSSAPGGSPGQPNPAPPVFPAVVINELLSRPTPPGKVAVELANLGASPANLSGWWLTDDLRAPWKFQLPPQATIPAGGYLVFTEDDFNAPIRGTNAFQFSPAGGEVRLFSAGADGALTGYVQGWDFGAAEQGVSFGRYVTSTGSDQFPAQTHPTFGGANTGPQVGPVVVSELMYHPPDFGTMDNTGDEFLELRNITSTNVCLSHPEAPELAWQVKGGVDFSFPTNLVLAAGECLLVVNFDPAADPATLAGFRSLYGVPESVRVLGPYGGKLNNDSDSVELKKPTLFATGLSGDVLVDKVSYHDSAPWPAGADAYGLSLQRRDVSAYGNDPTNWMAAAPTPAADAAAEGEPPFITLQPTNIVLATGSGATLSVTAGGTPPLRYQWRMHGTNVTGATNSTLDLFSLQPDQSGEYRVVAYNRAGAVVSVPATLTVIPPPRILVAPQDLTVFPLTNVSLSVLAYSVLPITYRWQFKGVDLPGATEAALRLTNVQPDRDGDYTAVVTDTLGQSVGAVARLAVTAHPVFTLQPTNRLVVLGTNATNVTLTALAVSSTPVRYQWLFNGAELPGATGVDLLLTNVQLTHAGDYAVMATDNYGSSTSTNGALLVALKPALVQQPQPLSLTVLAGQDATFTIVVSGTPAPGLRWRRKGLTYTNGLIANSLRVTPTNIFVTSTLTVTNVSYTNHADYYNVVVTNVGSAAASSSNAYLWVLSPPMITSQPTNTVVNPGSNASLRAAFWGNPAVSYQWWYNETNLLGSAATATATNVQTATLTLTNAQSTNEGGYSLVLSNEYGMTTSAVASLTLRKPPVILAQPQNTAAASGGTASFSLIVTGTPPYSYRWRFFGTNVPGATMNNATLALTNVQTSQAGDYSVEVTNPAGGATSEVAVLTVVTQSVRIDRVLLSAGPNSVVTLRFEVLANARCAVEFRDELESGSWQPLTNLPPLGVPQTRSVQDREAIDKPQRFYRLILR
jgi:hypothetical protein